MKNSGGAVVIYLFLADGFEETEALVTLDLMRRAGIDAVSVGVGSKRIRGTHGITVEADIDSAEVDLDSCDGVVLPGGMPGTNNLCECGEVRNAVTYCFNAGKMTAAICAAPLILGRLGVLNGKRAVCFPGFENELTGADVCASPAETDGTVITARGAGAVFEFSHAIISLLKDRSVADKVLADIRFPSVICG